MLKIKDKLGKLIAILKDDDSTPTKVEEPKVIVFPKTPKVPEDNSNSQEK